MSDIACTSHVSAAPQFSIDPHRVHAVVLDMDGTLLHTEQVIVQACSQALQHWGYAPLPVGYVMPNMHGTAGQLMADVLRDQGHPLPAGGQAAAGAVFEVCYAQQPHEAAPLYPGVRAWLQAARARGVALAVCTNKQADLARKGLQAHGILGLFDTVTGRDTFGVPKPAADPLLRTLQVLGVAPAAAVMVGDTHADAACAQAAQVPFAWFSAGFGTEAVHAYPRCGQFAHFADLPAWGGAQR